MPLGEGDTRCLSPSTTGLVDTLLRRLPPPRSGMREKKERRVYASQKAVCIRKGLLTSKLARVSPKGPQTSARHTVSGR
eukprot:1142179-Pelagomonas_calceolata.AAC.3